MNQKYILIIAVIILLGVGSYYVATKKAEAPVTGENPQNISISDETATDGKYRNDKLGFEIFVPGLTVEIIDGMNAGEGNTYLTFREKAPCDDATGCRWGRIDIYKKDPNYTLKSIKNYEPNSDTERDYSITWGPDTTIGGQPAIQGIVHESGIPHAYVIYNGNLYIFIRELILDPKILSTFKFTK